MWRTYVQLKLAWGILTSGKESGANPVELGPGHSHVAVVVGVVARAAEGLLSQEDEVLLRQASVTLHLSLVLHVDGIAQLRPKHFIWHKKRHPSLQPQRRRHRSYVNFIDGEQGSSRMQTTAIDKMRKQECTRSYFHYCINVSTRTNVCFLKILPHNLVVLVTSLGRMRFSVQNDG